MINIPFLSKFTTDDQEFYDAQINEELKFCSCSNYTDRNIHPNTVPTRVFLVILSIQTYRHHKANNSTHFRHTTKVLNFEKSLQNKRSKPVASAHPNQIFFYHDSHQILVHCHFSKSTTFQNLVKKKFSVYYHLLIISIYLFE